MDHLELAKWTRRACSWSEIPGFFDWESFARFLIDDAPPGSRLVEVGSLIGRSTCLLGTLARAADKDLHILAVDTCAGSVGSDDRAGVDLATCLGGSFAGVLHRNILGCGFEDIVSVFIGPSEQAAGWVQDRSCHAVLLDAGHSREEVTRDLRFWEPKVRQGGILCGHDYGHDAFPGVQEAVDRWWSRRDGHHVSLFDGSPALWWVRILSDEPRH